MPKSKTLIRKRSRVIPYKRGFKPPTEDQQLTALGLWHKNVVSVEYRSDGKFFQPVPKCTSIDDWLAQYNEKGQTYEDFLAWSPWIASGRKKVAIAGNILDSFPDKAIYLVQIGEFNLEESPDFKALIEYAKLFLGLPVRMLDSVDVEVKDGVVRWRVVDKDSVVKQERVKCRWDKKSGHYQLNVCDALDFLKKMKPISAFCLMALTNLDLYEAPKDLFVAGMASGNTYVGIFSLFRYDPNRAFSSEFWHEVKKKKSCSKVERRRKVLQRSCRLLVHEVSHLLGIDHCIYYACCMNGSGHLAEDFSQPMHLCPVDLRKLQRLVGFDVRDRYERLHAFYERHGLSDEAAWTKQRVECIGDALVNDPPARCESLAPYTKPHRVLNAST